MLVLALLAAAAPFQVFVDVAEFPNVLHHVSCLGKNVPCTFDEIEKFWRERLHWTSADQKQVDLWRATIRKIAEKQPKPAPSPFVPNFQAYYPEIAAVQRILAAGLESRSPADFRKRAAGLAASEEIGQLSAVLEHFQRRLRPWWTSEGRRYGESRRNSLAARLKSPEITALVQRIARFMNSEIVSRDFHVHLIPRGDPKSDAAKASFVRNHAFLEVTDNLQGEEVVAIVVHEIAHALYELAPIAKHRQLIDSFAAASNPQSQALYTLLNEGLATGVQIALMRQKGISDEDAYRHPFIPRIGRTVSAPLERSLTNGPTLFDGFLETYLRAGTDALGDEVASPRFILSSVSVALIGEMEQTSKAFWSEFSPLSSVDFGDRERYPELNLLFLLPYDKLGAIATNSEELLRLSRSHGGFAFAMPRKKKGRVFVVTGKDDKTAAEVVRRLAGMRTGAANGLILSVD
jgi:hypothetical protein